MPSPFPGMDPFLEGQMWPGFHTQFIAELQRKLAPELGPRYATYIQEQVYVVGDPRGEPRSIGPDAFVVERRPAVAAREPEGGTAVLTMSAPVTLLLPETETRKQVSLEVCSRATGRVVCVVEVLSPFNKERGAGLSQYVRKRNVVFQSSAHLVEIDLLRGGERLPMAAPYPPAAYYVLVSRREAWPLAGVWPIGLRDRLPMIPIPLAEGDPDVPLDMQQVLDAVYDAAGYADSLDYGAPPEPPLESDDAAWVEERLRETSPRGSGPAA